MASELFNGISLNLGDIRVSSIEYDSRQVVKDSCFVAVKGFTVDGHDFIKDAISKGASLIVLERKPDFETDVPVVVVPDSRRELAKLSDRFYGHPSGKLGLIGITGTNGKTTVSYLVERMLQEAGHSVSRFGTIEYHFPDKTLGSPNTTPESADLQKLLAQSADYRNPRCVLEVSSHGLALGRLKETSFKGGVFMNLTQDHLDFHPDMNDYENAKRKLFTEFKPEYSVINVDDAVGKKWVSEGLPGKVITFGFSENADIRVVERKGGWEGSLLTLATPDGEYSIKTSLPGKHNVYNVLATIGVGVAEKFSQSVISKAVSSVKKIPGRFELVEAGQKFAVVVDYAHTDNALANLLQTARELTTGRVICLFGCGGDRDHGKRKLMGAVADKLADIVIVTSDNPRTEEPGKIIEEILTGIESPASERVRVIESRRKAIRDAIELAEQGDCVLIAGKGHETYQIIGKKKFDFDDRLIAADVLKGVGKP
ncbi:MAG: UDP-N-acetylmuramoyl-L-alanyl-D-glutamate--2,6-diaminopimelate ligase [Nitrospinota bacterium]|nr:UDP-N-acetylmuramoyl-L-alanyl-D-glutamate--2,6-diaminopimelate ligase [Nitrospinota bacterium]